MIYLDSAATSLLKPPSVPEAMEFAVKTMASPGRGGHAPAMAAAETVYDCRCAAAGLFNVPSPEQVVFTSSATHGLNIAIRSVLSPGDRAVISGYEHNSVTRVLHSIGTHTDVVRSPLFDADAALEVFAEKIPGADCVICTHVSNVFGFVLPVSGIARLCRENGVPLIIDASQSAGSLDVDFSALGAEYIAMPGHKGLMGPQGTGVLLCADGGKPFMCGGTGSESINQDMPEFLPDRLEAGTHNVCGIAGLLEGIRYVSAKTTDAIGEYEILLKEAAADMLGGVPGLEVFSSEKNQAGVLSVRHEKIDCESICAALADRGIAVRGGLHCAPTAHETAGTLATGTVRLSFSPFTRLRDVEKACRELEKITAAGKNFN